MRVRVDGTKQLSRMAKVLEEQGNSRALKRRMTKAFKVAAEPIMRDQKQNLREELPKRGGAAATITGESRFYVRTGWEKATVDIIDSWPGHDMRAINNGNLRHPLFGNRGYWYTTRVPALMLTIPFLEHRRTVVAELKKAMDGLAEEISRRT